MTEISEKIDQKIRTLINAKTANSLKILNDLTYKSLEYCLNEEISNLLENNI